MTDVTTTYTGQRAEQVAADYLLRKGYTIVTRNWRRRDCEIDIVAQLESTVYLVEVKYRHSDRAGSGLEYITSAKLRRMSYAAQRWVSENRWNGQYVLAAVEVAGDEFKITAFIDCIQ